MRERGPEEEFERMYELQSDILILEPLAKLNLNLGFFRIFGLLSEKK